MNDRLEKVAQYNQLVQQYHDLGRDIDALLAQHQGRTENMSEDDMKQYRTLARERDDLFNQLRVMEEELLADQP